MRVLCLVHQYVPVRNAGAETHIHAMLRALARRGHRVDAVLSAQDGPEYSFEGVHVHPTVDRRSDPLRWLPEADLLVTHLDNTTRATCLGEWNQVPTVVVQHNTFDHAYQALSREGQRVDLVVTNSEWMRRDMGEWFRRHRRTFRGRRVSVCRPVADPADYSTVPGDRVTLINLRRRDNGDSGRKGITKGGELFAEVARRMPCTRFLGVTGVYGAQQEVSLPNVEVIDHVPHNQVRERIYGRTRILMVPSNYESWGRVASEALCSGIPVIAHPAEGLAEQLGDAGIYCDFQRPDEWVREIGRLADPGRWEVASWAARARAAELHRLGSEDLDRWCVDAERTAMMRRVLI